MTTAPAQMPSEPPIVRDSRKFAHPESIEFDLLAHIDALRAHAESLQAELVRELASHYSTYMQLKDAERKLAEAVSAALIFRGRLLLENPHARTDDADLDLKEATK